MYVRIKIKRKTPIGDGNIGLTPTDTFLVLKIKRKTPIGDGNGKIYQ